MNKETYQALKRILSVLPNFSDKIQDYYCKKDNYQKDVKQIENWIYEVAKDYEECSFEKWEKENEERLLEDYRYYLDDSVIENESWNLKMTENYWEWAKEEYKIELENIEKV